MLVRVEFGEINQIGTMIMNQRIEAQSISPGTYAEPNIIPIFTLLMTTTNLKNPV